MPVLVIIIIITVIITIIVIIIIINKINVTINGLMINLASSFLSSSNSDKVLNPGNALSDPPCHKDRLWT